jgi:hypothetical protein
VYAVQTCLGLAAITLLAGVFGPYLVARMRDVGLIVVLLAALAVTVLVVRRRQRRAVAAPRLGPDDQLVGVTYLLMLLVAPLLGSALVAAWVRVVCSVLAALLVATPLTVSVRKRGL